MNYIFEAESDSIPVRVWIENLSSDLAKRVKVSVGGVVRTIATIDAGRGEIRQWDLRGYRTDYNVTYKMGEITNRP